MTHDDHINNTLLPLLKHGVVVKALKETLANAGLVIVPKEPTETMIHAGIHAPCWEVDTVQFGSDYMVPNGIRMYPGSVYRAMIAAVEGDKG